MLKSAYISPDGLYRYALRRQWDESRPCLTWCLLNSSTACDTTEDATTRILRARSEVEDYGGFILINLCAYRTPSPQALFKAPDPVGPDNVAAWCQALTVCDGRIMAAWGAHGANTVQEKKFLAMAAQHDVSIWALRLTKEGAPGHPLYVPYSVKPFEWRKAGIATSENQAKRRVAS